MFLFCCLSETSSPQRCKNTEKTRVFFGSFSFSQKSSTIQKQIKTKEQIRGATLWSTTFFLGGGYFVVGVFPFFVFFVVYLFHLLCVFIVSLLFSFVLCFPSCFFWLFCFLCLSLWSKSRKIKKKGQQRKEEIKKEKKKEEKGNPPKQRRIFEQGFCFVSVLLFICNILPQRCQQHWKTRISLVLSHSLENQAPSTNTSKQKNNQNKRTNQGGNLMIYHVGGYFFAGLSPFFVLWFIFIIFFVFSLFLFFYSFVLFFLSCFFWLFCFLCLSLWSKRRKTKKKGNNERKH